MRHQHDDPTRRRFEELLEARKAGIRAGGTGGGSVRPTDRPGRSTPARDTRTFRRRKV